MIKGNIPNNKKDAEIYLSAYKQAFLDIAAKVSTQEIGTDDNANKYIWGSIKEAEEIMESGCYEDSWKI